MATIKMKAPAGNKSGAGFGGEFYKVKKGFVEVPEAAAAELTAHGFTLEDEGEGPGDDDTDPLKGSSQAGDTGTGDAGSVTGADTGDAGKPSTEE